MEPPRKPSLILKFGLAFFVLFASAAFLFDGIDNIQHYAIDRAKVARYPAPVTLTYDDFVRRRPKEGWFRITGGVVDLASATAINEYIGGVEQFGSIVQVEAPLRSKKNTHQEPIYIAVTSKDEKLCDAWSHLHHVQEGTAADGIKADGSDPSSVEEENAREAARISYYLAEHPEKAFIPRDVEGIILTGDYSDMRKTSKTSTPQGMAEDYVLLKEGATGANYQRRTVRAGIIETSTVALFWGWWLWRKISGWRKRSFKARSG